MFLIFYLGRPSVLFVEDGAVRQVFRWLYGARSPTTAFARWCARYGGRTPRSPCVTCTGR